VPKRDQTDRRRYRRRTVRVLVEYLSDAGLCCDTATTLGAGGLFIETDQPLPVGSEIKLTFKLPERDTRHEIEGRVSWVHHPAGAAAGVPGMGVEFRDRAGSLRAPFGRLPCGPGPGEARATPLRSPLARCARPSGAC
jgi:uncharacterized protein (TIGR02266 family)